ncbi:lactose permease [Pyrenophora seminiperda CCB06]|uniref:Lactose permease n=1 Tax=Pyrenophora seminiperda CCB06 TaxID=1302712 RepID=A0A3M7MHY0_9PLEO|nr:lactose permease [Pyrenophora seminiperda CCB06]
MKMVSAFPVAEIQSALSTTVANTGFRLGDEHHFSDASDSDQSQASQRSLPSQANAQGPIPVPKSKKKKQKERRKMGALADELVDVLGSAFSANSAHLKPQTDSAQPPCADQSMTLDPEPAGRKMSKRTRQNLAKMQARKERNLANPTMKDVGEDKTLQAQAKAAERRGLSLDKYLKLRESGTSKKAVRACRRKKKAEIREQRTVDAAVVTDAMEMC